MIKLVPFDGFLIHYWNCDTTDQPCYRTKWINNPKVPMEKKKESILSKIVLYCTVLYNHVL